MDAITFIVISIILCIVIYYNNYYGVYEMISKLPGPSGLPVLGIALELARLRPTELLNYFDKKFKEHGRVVSFMLGYQHCVLFTDPNDAEVILSSQKVLEKTDEYNFLTEWLGLGLLISSGQKWHLRRKAITPAFHFKILDQFIEVFDRQSSIFVEKISNFSRENPIEFFHPITMCALDIICEAAMGVEVKAQVNSDSVYVKAVKEITMIMMEKSINVFMRLNFIFKLTSHGRRQKELLKLLHGFTDNVIISRREELMRNKNESRETDENDDVGAKKKMAFLDILLQSTIDGKPLSNMDIREEVDTFMFEGHDTTSSGIAFCLYNLAKHPEIQQKAFEEIRHVMGDDLTKPTLLSDLNELKYLEMVIKETLRLYPPVVAYGRKLRENFEINGKLIPSGTNIGVCPFYMARDSGLWKDPLKFIPERFNTDKPQTHPYLNVPFSAGPRNCIGQRFAMLEMKSVISKVLRNFELSVAPEYEPILVFEIILRPCNGLMLLINKRQY